MPRSHAITQTVSPQYVVLGLLKLEPSHGYVLHQRLETELNHLWRISLSQVYNILHRLDKQGYIQTTGNVSPRQDADRVRFKITKLGDQHLKTWMETPIGPSIRAIRMAFITKLYIAHHLNQPAIENLISTQRAAIDTQLERLTTSLESIPKAQLINRLAQQMRIKQLESLQIWFEEILNDIDITLERET